MNSSVTDIKGSKGFFECDGNGERELVEGEGGLLGEEEENGKGAVERQMYSKKKG